MFFFLVKKSCVNFGQNHSVSISWKDQWDIRLYTKNVYLFKKNSMKVVIVVGVIYAAKTPQPPEKV